MEVCVCLSFSRLQVLYLDYPETAVRLQKEWNMQDPQLLSFAPHVQPHALVSLLNRGLLYNMHERGFAAQVCSSKLLPLTIYLPHLPKNLVSAMDTPQARLTKTAAVRLWLILKSMREEAIPPEQVTNHDEYADEQAYPSPEQMPTPRPIIVTCGPEKGTQVEAVEDLTSDTVFLELTENSVAQGSVILHCAFHPRNPASLVAAGSDALARIWSLQPQAPSTDQSPLTSDKQMVAAHRNLYGSGVPITTQATALSWAPNGQYLAIASQPSDKSLARVDFWLEDASLVSSNNGFESPIIDIQWNQTGTACLTVSPQNDAVDTALTVIYPDQQILIRHTLLGHNLVEQILETTWMTDEKFLLCGGNILQVFNCSTQSNLISEERKFEVPEGAMLSRVAYDFHTQLIATASDAGTIYIWGLDQNVHTYNAHQGLVTLLVWQPLPLNHETSSITERLLASAGEDGAISLWNALSSSTRSQSSMTMRSGVSAIEFSPDGLFVAGATNNDIFIWKTNSTHIPRAMWNHNDEVGWQTPQSSEYTPGEEEICSLSWNSDGRRLAYGINNRLALINFCP
ncbi:WD repeat protein [Blumeria hordei DH14]|uniref:WD repeat protein n=1 Tax=Blumeria graminis f. sp. hordei (strain DH14) TaxID=546991 RepID=N1JAM5_BLUG1|nr:WD repeat protein [Blumeria hordei DH14]